MRCKKITDLHIRKQHIQRSQSDFQAHLPNASPHYTFQMRFVPRKTTDEVGTEKATQRKGTRNRGCGLARGKASKMPTEAPHRVGIAAHLHTSQLEPVPVRIQLCGPVREPIISINNVQAYQMQKQALSYNGQISHYYPRV